MMRDLTAVHASMTAANKIGNPRAGRRGAHAPVPPSPTAPNGNHMNGGGSPTDSHHSVDTALLIKEEDLGLSLHPHHPHHRTDPNSPFGTDHSFYNHQPSPWHVQGPADLDPNARQNSPHAFQQQQPYLSFTPTLTFGLPSDPPRSRPTTSSGTAERLPPLSAIIPSPESQQSLQEYQQQQLQHNQLQQQGYVPSTLRPRPGTGSGRPGSSSANAFFFGNSKSPSATAFYNSGLAFGRPYGEYDGAPASTTAAHASQDPSPFYFHPDDAQTNGDRNSPPGVNGNGNGNPNGRSPASTTHGSGTTSPGSATPPGGMQTRSPSHLGGHPTPVLSRKRTLGGPDGPYDGMYPASIPPSSVSVSHPNGAGGPDYDYGSESRPQSRRLSVLELCNENGGNVPVEVFGMGMHHPHSHSQHQHQQHGMGMVNGMMGGMMVNVNGANGFATPGELYHHHHRGVSRSPSEVMDLAQVQQMEPSAAAAAMHRASSVASMRSHNNGSVGPDPSRGRGKMSPPSSGRRPAPAPLTLYGDHHHQQQQLAQHHHHQQQQQLSYHQQFAPSQPHSPYAPSFPGVTQSQSPTVGGAGGEGTTTTSSTPVTPFLPMPAYLQQQQQQRASPRHPQESPLPSPHPAFVEGFAYQQQQGPGYPGGYAVGHHQM